MDCCIHLLKILNLLATVIVIGLETRMIEKVLLVLYYMGDIAFTWISKKQPIVTLSTYEAEYIATTSSVCHAIWFRSFLKELQMLQKEATKIFVDNKLALAFAKNLVFHDRSKHIDTIILFENVLQERK